MADDNGKPENVKSIEDVLPRATDGNDRKISRLEEKLERLKTFERAAKIIAFTASIIFAAASVFEAVRINQIEERQERNEGRYIQRNAQLTNMLDMHGQELHNQQKGLGKLDLILTEVQKNNILLMQHDSLINILIRHDRIEWQTLQNKKE